MDLAATINANLQEAERRIQETVCPIYGIDNRDRPQLLGSSVLLRVTTRSFLLTAAHVLDENKKKTTLYVGGADTLVELTGSSHRVASSTPDRGNDTLDFGIVDISDTPSVQWSRYRFLTPDDLDVDDIPKEHTLYAFVGSLKRGISPSSAESSV